MTAEREKQQVYYDMLVDVEEIRMEITTLGAEATANRTALEADINSEAFFEVTGRMSQAYADLKTECEMTNTELIEYLQTKMIKDMPTGGLVVSVNK